LLAHLYPDVIKVKNPSPAGKSLYNLQKCPFLDEKAYPLLTRKEPVPSAGL
jgi:hypothetical protein